jgi:hypothetical protein
MRTVNVDEKTAVIPDKSDLALHLWEGLVRELIVRRTIDADALERIMAGAPSSDTAETKRLRYEIGARLAQDLPTPLQLIDRDGVPDTED